MAPLELQLRAYPLVTVQGRSVALKLKRGLALLCVLAELGRKVARAQLAAKLWPDATVGVGRARLRRVAHETNQALGADAIVGDGDALWLSPDLLPVTSDVDHVRQTARSLMESPEGQDASEALGVLLKPGAHEVLEGFELGVESFDGWVAQRRSEQHRLVARALERAGERLVASGRADLAIEAADRLVAIDPFADAGHALLLRAHGGRGDLAAVEAAYLSFAELLRSELGVRPSPRYESIYEQVRRRAARSPDITDVTPSIRSETPDIHFADTSDGAVAYLTVGASPQTMIVLLGLWSHIETAWEEPTIRTVLLRLARRFRVVLMDRRGVGLSERVGVTQSVSASVEDIDAVRRAVGAEEVWLFGNAVGGMAAIEFAALNADHVRGLVLYAAAARGSWAPDYPWALTLEQLEAWSEQLRANWGQATSLAAFAPSQAGAPAMQAWWARLMRQAMSRNGLPDVLRAFGRMDVRHRLPGIRVPTLILHREGDRIARVGAARYLAQHIAGSTLRVLPGDDHLLTASDVGPLVDEIGRFVDAVSPATAVT